MCLGLGSWDLNLTCSAYNNNMYNSCEDGPDGFFVMLYWYFCENCNIFAFLSRYVDFTERLYLRDLFFELALY